MHHTHKYIIITPAKDEEKFIINTLDSVIGQTLLPVLWIIVNDGSNDNTPKIVEQYSRNYPWIKLINNDTITEKREEGGKIVRAFYKGFEIIKNIDFEFLVKLDADLSLPDNYFELIADQYLSNNRIGMCGGYITSIVNGIVVEKTRPDYHLRGAIKSYRKNCYDDIGGLKPVLGWDGLDEMSAMFKGWVVKIIDVEVIQYRLTAKSYNQMELNFKRGLFHYRKGSSLLLMIIRVIVKMIEKPYIIKSIVLFSGYIYGYISRKEKIIDKELREYINKYHYKRIVKYFAKLAQNNNLFHI